MKRAVFLTGVMITFYVAAMFRSLPLMLLSVADLFLAVGMWILSHYLKRKVTVEFPRQSMVQKQGEKSWYDCRIVNTAKLPVSRLRIRFRVRYFRETKGSVKYLYGAAECGTSNLHFAVHAPYCGIVCLTFDRIRIYDYLGLFYGTKTLEQELWVAVFPSGQPLLLEPSSQGWDEGSSMAEASAHYMGDAHNEIRQLRTYQMGDSYRHIHWNQSARTDKIWMKEYEKETESHVELLLETDRYHWKHPGDLDGFYRLLYALVPGLLQKAKMVKVYWYDGHPNALVESVIRDERQCQDLLWCLYQMDLSEWEQGQQEKLLERYVHTHDNYWKLRSDLCWYRNEEMIYQFSRENLEREIAEKIFVL